MLVEKYEIFDVWNLNEIRRPHGNSLWKGIVKHLDYFKKEIGHEIAAQDKIYF